MNKLIEELITEQKYEEALSSIDAYESFQIGDSDIYTYRFLYYLGIGNNGLALQYAKKAVKEQPYVADVHYNCAYAYEINNHLYEAYEQYIIAYQIISYGNKSDITLDEAFADVQRVLELVLDSVKNKSLDKHKLDYIVDNNKYLFGVLQSEFYLDADIIGTEYMDYITLDKMYVGCDGLKSSCDLYIGELKKDTVHSRAELQRVSDVLHNKKIMCEQESFVPVISDNQDNIVWTINEKDKLAVVPYKSPYQYVNYRVPKGITELSSDIGFRVGEIIPIYHDPNRKKLVLNIFIDGLSETVLGEHFNELMPHTYKFFKKGLVCINTHTAGDWTFPSVASIVTGQALSNHKMLHSKILRKIDIDTPILFEYFKNAGYNTTKIGGNWRVAPNYGYARGMNRVKYQNMFRGYNVEDVVADVEEQMHSMSDTDQFIWMEIGELHLIADEIYNAPFQSEFMVWENEHYNGKINSVKQNYDETKIKYYKKQIEYIDRRLAGLYQYIEENYKDEDIVVSLFADHGQGYLIKPEDEFLCDERSKVAFMFRGSNVSGVTDEVISSCDYSGIMCKLAGIDYDYSNTDANLPVVFGGSSERSFCVTESIHVGDPYQIVLNGKDFKFYLKGFENVNAECRVPLNDFKTILLDNNGNEIYDKARISYYTEWCLKHISSCRIFDN